jgi:hypothetical protein
VRKVRVTLAALAVLASIVLAMPSANAENAGAAACGTRVDIGVTVFDNGYIRGSGSYTSQSCLALYKVSIVLVRGVTELGDTRVTKYPSEPSSLKFSARDHRCEGTSQWLSWRTKIKWEYQGGGGGQKYSNTVRARCW